MTTKNDLGAQSATAVEAAGSIDVDRLSHAALVEIAAKWLKRQGCNVVLTERFAGNDHRGECPDAVGWWCSDFTSAVIECKRSRSDFIADALKPHRKGPAMGRERWYLAPKGLLRPLAWPNGWGLLEWDGRVVRRVIEPVPFFADRDINSEAKLLLAELRIYHAQGITYRKFGTGNPVSASEIGSLRSEALKDSPNEAGR